MILFILGAGKSVSSNQPVALAEIKYSIKALDWLLAAFRPLIELSNSYFLGGFRIADINESYPSLKTLFIPDWERTKVIDTFFQIPWPNDRAVVCYADTIFTKSLITELCERDEDIVICADSNWKKRYENRSKSDIDRAEKIIVDRVECEFTGLACFSQRAISKILEIQKSGNLCPTIPDLISLLTTDKSLTNHSIDAPGQWAEFNSRNDVAQLILGTKADTLLRLETTISKSKIGHQVSFSYAEWQHDKDSILKKIAKNFPSCKLAVRSSAKTEDGWTLSNAGQYESVLDISSENLQVIRNAISKVFDSYGKPTDAQDQVLVQKQITRTRLSGVVFTRGLEFNSPYYRINFIDQIGNTRAITEGSAKTPRTLFVSRIGARDFKHSDDGLTMLMSAVLEIEELLQYDKLDIEFAVDQSNNIHIFQVRPLTTLHQQFSAHTEKVDEEIASAIRKFSDLQQPSPFVHGDSTIFGVMPDWNPAEILGRHPRPLAFTLYRYLITDEVWAKQRAEFGYCDVRPNALMISFAGQPFIDVRASVSSLIPEALSTNLKNKLANAYLEILKSNPNYHDKIEFDVAFTTWCPGIDEIASFRFKNFNIEKTEFLELKDALVEITRSALKRLQSDIEPVSHLACRRATIQNSGLNPLGKACALIKDCKEFGTLPFAHAARAGFIGTTLLKSLVASECLTPDRHQQFLRSIKTISSDFEYDQKRFLKGNISSADLSNKYGHLRPGSYEITSAAYWENPEKYLYPQTPLSQKPSASFRLQESETKKIKKLLDEVRISISPANLFSYIEESVQARESVKFEFTKNLSLALDYLIEYGSDHGLSRELLSFIEFSEFEKLNLNQDNLKIILVNAENREQQYNYQRMVELPSLITCAEDFVSFERSFEEPNFITDKSVVAEALVYSEGFTHDMDQKIVLIENADPGFEFLFSRSIAGLITQYGGANSHMAIRAAERGLPSAIGVGEAFFEEIRDRELLELNCNSKTIKKVKC